MILKEICIFSQNIYKNNFLINIILKTQSVFNIIFIQELSWIYIWSIPSLNNQEREKLVEVLNHSNWSTFSKKPTHNGNSPRVITYINIYLSFLQFSFYKNIYNHRNILLVFFSNGNSVYYMMNIYSDSS